MWPLHHLFICKRQVHLHSILESASWRSRDPSRRDFESINSCETFHAEERIGPNTQGASFESRPAIGIDEHAVVSSQVITSPSGVRAFDRISGRCHDTTQKCQGAIPDSDLFGKQGEECGIMIL